MEIAEDLVLESSRPLLVDPGQVDPTCVASKALLVVVIVVVDRRRFCRRKKVMCQKLGNGRVYLSPSLMMIPFSHERKMKNSLP